MARSISPFERTRAPPRKKTQHDTCASNYDDYRTKCLTVLGTVAAGGTPTGVELFSCRDAANVMAADACPCVNVDDGYGVDRSISSTSDIRLSFILNAPGQGCVDVLGSAGFTANTYTCTSPPSPPPSPPPRDPTYTLPRHVRHPVDESEAESILEGWEKAWLDGIEEATKDFEHIDVTRYAARSLGRRHYRRLEIGVRIHRHRLCFGGCFLLRLLHRRSLRAERETTRTRTGNLSHYRVHS